MLFPRSMVSSIVKAMAVVSASAIVASLAGCAENAGNAGRDGAGAGAGGPGTGSADGGAGDTSTDGGSGGGILGVTDLTFVPGPNGPRIMVRGTDPRRELETLHFELLGSDGAPAMIDPDGDGTGESNVIDLAANAVTRTAGGFVLEVQGSVGLDTFARAVSLEIESTRGALLPKRTATLAPLPVRRNGEACDVDGFDRCEETFVCAMASSGVARCEDPSAARARRCATAPVLDAVNGSVATASTAGPSLWEPSTGCTNGLRTGRPEGVVRLHVATKTATLKLSTEAAATSFDTVLTVLGDCTAAAAELACNDDVVAPFSEVTLSNIGPGDYLVVVDALDTSGGSFAVRAVVP